MSIANEVGTFERQAERLFVIYKEHVSRVCASVGLTPTQYWALFVIAELGETRMSPLASSLGLTPGAASTLVDRLADVGLVDRRAEPSDRRVVFVHVTEKGHAYLLKAKEEKQRTVQAVLSKMAPEKRVCLTEGLDAVLEAWELLLQEELAS